jgi:dTDP-4-amino-4,6-dideoxygalactose transaminase
MRVPFGRPIIENEEKQAVASILNGPILVHGPKASEFEDKFAEFTKAPSAVSVASCTAGMHLIYFALGLKEGDEVIVPAQTHVATAHAAELTGAKAIFVDVNADYDGNVILDKILEAVTNKTKAIAVVHYLGSPVDIKKLADFCKAKKIFLLEDCAHAVGTYYEGLHAGLHGDAGVFSFYPVKHITTAEGGMVITKNESLAREIKLLKAFGIDRHHGERVQAGIYDSKQLGFNYRMSEIHAAIGVEQIKKINRFLDIRKNNFHALEKVIENFNCVRLLKQPFNEVKHSSFYCMGLLLSEKIKLNRQNIMNDLKNLGIGSSIYYPHPVPRMSYYQKKNGYKSEDFKGAAMISDTIIALPVGPHISNLDLNYMIDTLKQIIGNYEL